MSGRARIGHGTHVGALLTAEEKTQEPTNSILVNQICNFRSGKLCSPNELELLRERQKGIVDAEHQASDYGR